VLRLIWVKGEEGKSVRRRMSVKVELGSICMDSGLRHLVGSATQQQGTWKEHYLHWRPLNVNSGERKRLANKLSLSLSRRKSFE